MEEGILWKEKEIGGVRRRGKRRRKRRRMIRRWSRRKEGKSERRWW